MLAFKVRDLFWHSFKSKQRCSFTCNGIGKPRVNQVADDGSDCVPLKVSLGERYDYYDPR